MAHPQPNSQIEVSNNIIVAGLKKRLWKETGCWVRELPTVLWSYHITMHISMKETPFSLTYRIEAILLTEIIVSSLRTTYFDKRLNSKEFYQNLNMLDEKKEVVDL